VHKFVFIARRVIASDGTRLALHGVDQHWLKVQGGGVEKGGSYLHGTAQPYTLWFVITRNSLSLSVRLRLSP
jgi:hypothetical protein